MFRSAALATCCIGLFIVAGCQPEPGGADVATDASAQRHDARAFYETTRFMLPNDAFFGQTDAFDRRMC